MPLAVAEHPAWLPIAPWKQGRVMFDPYRKDVNEPRTFDLDRPLFDRIKAIYDARGCWTWAWEPVEKCRVYSL